VTFKAPPSERQPRAGRRNGRVADVWTLFVLAIESIGSAVWRKWKFHRVRRGRTIWEEPLSRWRTSTLSCAGAAQAIAENYLALVELFSFTREACWASRS
jgi:hypothetical protein